MICGAAGLSYATKMKPHHGDGHLFFMLDKVTKDLNLSSDQKTQIQTLKDEIKAKKDGIKKDNQTGSDDFGNAFKQDKLDKETLKSIEQKRVADREEMKEFFMDELIKYHDILNSDQRTQVVTKLEDLRKNHNSWNHKDNKKNKPENN